MSSGQDVNVDDLHLLFSWSPLYSFVSSSKCCGLEINRKRVIASWLDWITFLHVVYTLAGKERDWRRV
jgi:hypothetical protein